MIRVMGDNRHYHDARNNDQTPDRDELLLLLFPLQPLVFHFLILSVTQYCLVYGPG